MDDFFAFAVGADSLDYSTVDSAQLDIFGTFQSSEYTLPQTDHGFSFGRPITGPSDPDTAEFGEFVKFGGP